MFQGIFKSAINDANKNYIFGTGSIPINIKTAQLATFADGTTKQQGYQVAEVNKLISTMLTGWDANGNKPKSMSDNYLELILSCDNGFVVKKRLQFPHIIAWKDDSTPYNIADIYKQFSIDNWLKADDFENPDITLVVEPTDEILTTSTATPPEATTTNSGRFYLYYRNLPIGVNRVHIDFHIKTKTEPIDFDLEIANGMSWKDAQAILASNAQAKINILLSGVKDVYKFTGAEGNFENITMHEWSALYQQIISLNPSNKFTHDLYFYLYEESELNTKITELKQNESYIEESLNTNERYILLEEGALDNSGNNTPHEGWQRSKDYIPIVTSINNVSSSPSYGISTRYYDENKAYVGRYYISSAKYFRFILTTSEKPISIYINDGGVTTEYKTEKYKKTLSVGDIKENAVIDTDALRLSLEGKTIFNLVDYSVQNNIGANGAFNIPKAESFYDVAARLNRAELNINAVQKIVTPPAITYTAVSYFYPNAFVGKNGSINATGANYGYSVPFMAFKGDIITIQIAGNPNVTAILSSCNQYGQAINPILLATSSSFIEYTYEVEDTNYFIVSGSLANTPIVKLTSNNVDKTLLSNIKRVESKEEYIRNKHFYFEKSDFISEVKDSLVYVYEVDKANNNEHIVNAVAYPNGEIIACRDYGKVVKIANDGTETTLLTINNASDWRGMYIDKNYNVYVSPHDTLGHGLSVSDRGLYRLAYGETSFEKVISLYNPSSAIPTEQQNNNDTIWTMCEDRNGYLYAGVYAHSTRANPAIYRSIDGGITWSYLYNFIDSGLAVPNGQFGNPMHIHCIIYNEFNDALYCIVGEVETIYKSTNKGETWVDLGCRTEDEKGTTLIATPDGVLIGSDGHWEGVISKLYSDDKTVKTVGKMWHAEFFAMRKSDVTGWLYAFTKIESAIVNTSIYPPKEAINSATALQTWKDSQSASSVKAWERYNYYVSSHYNHDDIHPNRCAVLVSKDNGETWEIVFSKDCGAYANGIWCVGYFHNGECLCGLTIGDTNRVFTNPIVISEGKHKFGTNGIDISGDIFSKL